MNPLLQEAVRQIQHGWLAALMTVVFLACFIAFVWWALLPRNRQRFDDAARLPLSDGDENE